MSLFFIDPLEACISICNLEAAFKEEVAPAPAPTPAPVLAVGAVVILQGLKSAPELNDQKGEIETWSLQSKEREDDWWLVLERDGNVYGDL